MSSDFSDVLNRVRFDDQGLVPAVVLDVHTREPLMLAYMNRESLRMTLERRETYFYSRSRRQLWHKGETSGNTQSVRHVRLDCDSDTLLIEVEPQGPACHKGSYSCFGIEPGLDGFLAELYAVVEQRKQCRPDGSYSSYLFDRGLDKILKKVGEEAAETIVASKNEDRAQFVAETADLVYHLVVLLVEKGVPLEAVTRELMIRHASKSGRG